jgi:glycosyltransferase involved in cell wall biosynthesis
MPEVSVIIPIYNSEKYLHECLDSVINQTYKDIEIILVDDGSTDKSGSICDEYSRKDKRIKVFHTLNNGPSHARNIGIDNATGEYIVFQDSDDYIELNMIEDMIYEAYKNDSDLVISGHKIFFEEKSKKPIIVCFDKTIYKNRKDFLNVFRKYFQTMSIWGRLYKSYIIKRNNISFIRNVSFGEDLIFNSIYYGKINKVSVLEKIHYAYRFLENSLVHKYREDIVTSIYSFYNEIKKLLINNSAYSVENKEILNGVCFDIYMRSKTTKTGCINDNGSKKLILENMFDISFIDCIGWICQYITLNRESSLKYKLCNVRKYMNKDIVIEFGKYFKPRSNWEIILTVLIRRKMPFSLIITIALKDALKKIFPRLEKRIL